MTYKSAFCVLYDSKNPIKENPTGFATNYRRRDFINMKVPLYIVIGQHKPEISRYSYGELYYYVLRYTNDGKTIFKRVDPDDKYMLSPINDLNEYEKTLILLNSV